MRLVLYAHDLGPARNLARIALAAIEGAHRAAFIGNDDEIFSAQQRPGTLLGLLLPDVVLTGLSSFNNDDEVWLGEVAAGKGIPWVVVADSHRTWARPTAKGRVNKAILLVASPAETETAKAFGYGRVVYLGGPPLWQEYPGSKPAEVKRRHPESKVILVGGIKDALLTDRMLGAVVEACRGHALLGEPWELIFKPHANEEAMTKDPERRAKILGGVTVIDTQARTENLIPAVDLSVFTSGSTNTIAAAYLRAPVIYYEDGAVRERMAKQIGEPTWFPAEAGACLKANSSQTMRDMIGFALAAEGIATKELRQRQEDIYPLPPKDKSVEQHILQFLSGLTGKK